MRTLLWLDDIRDPAKSILSKSYNITWVKCYSEFKEYLDKSMPDYVSFDHDLGFGPNGYECAKYLVQKCQELGIHTPVYFVHSSNPVGRRNIESYLDSYNRTF